MTDPNTATPTTDPTPAVSPTGLPVLPPKAVPWLVLAGAVAFVVSGAPDIGVVLPAAVVGVSKLVLGFCSLLGLVSPGMRRVQP